MNFLILAKCVYKYLIVYCTKGGRRMTQGRMRDEYHVTYKYYCNLLLANINYNNVSCFNYVLLQYKHKVSSSRYLPYL